MLGGLFLHLLGQLGLLLLKRGEVHLEDVVAGNVLLDLVLLQAQLDKPFLREDFRLDQLRPDRGRRRQLSSHGISALLPARLRLCYTPPPMEAKRRKKKESERKRKERRARAEGGKKPVARREGELGAEDPEAGVKEVDE